DPLLRGARDERSALELDAEDRAADGGVERGELERALARDEADALGRAVLRRAELGLVDVARARELGLVTAGARAGRGRGGGDPRARLDEDRARREPERARLERERRAHRRDHLRTLGPGLDLARTVGEPEAALGVDGERVLALHGDGRGREK